VLHAMAFRGEISSALAELGLERFLTGKIKVLERRPDGLAKAAWQVAGRFGWAKTYDAEYVALAEAFDCRLVTVDVKLRNGAERLGFVVTPAEL
jgi:predicted nucleic acid-binding protein